MIQFREVHILASNDRLLGSGLGEAEIHNLDVVVVVRVQVETLIIHLLAAKEQL